MKKIWDFILSTVFFPRRNKQTAAELTNKSYFVAGSCQGQLPVARSCKAKSAGTAQIHSTASGWLSAVINCCNLRQSSNIWRNVWSRGRSSFSPTLVVLFCRRRRAGRMRTGESSRLAEPTPAWSTPPSDLWSKSVKSGLLISLPVCTFLLFATLRETLEWGDLSAEFKLVSGQISHYYFIEKQNFRYWTLIWTYSFTCLRSKLKIVGNGIWFIKPKCTWLLKIKRMFLWCSSSDNSSAAWFYSVFCAG